MATHNDRGQFVWYELLTTDPAGAIEFYTKVIDWEATPWGEGDHPYTMWKARGKDCWFGGLEKLPEDARKMGAPPHWMAHITVPSVDEAVIQVRELGGSVVVPPTDIPKVGRFAVVADPQGATTSLFTGNGEPMPPPDRNQLGAFSWHELYTTDWKAAWKFYQTLLGWKHTSSMDMGPDNTYFMFTHPDMDSSFGGMMNKPAEMPAPPHWLHYINVADIDVTVEKIKQHGGKILNGPMEIPGNDWIAIAMDPQGAAFAVYAPGAHRK